MSQDALVRKMTLAATLGVLALGCQSSGKNIAPKQPVVIHTPAKAAAHTKTAGPPATSMTTTPSRSPVVNGGAAMIPPAPQILPITPGMAAPIGTPTINSTSPISQAPAVPVTVAKAESALPVMPPTPPEVSNPVLPPVSSSILPPASIN